MTLANSTRRHRVALLAASSIVVAPAIAQESKTAPVPPLDWQVGTPASQQLDAAALERISNRIQGGEFGGVRTFLVVRRGTLVFERYYRGWEVNQPHTVQSVTKSVTSALIGIAIAEGKIKGIDQPLAELLPHHAALLQADPRKQQLTLRHVLTMTLGNDWDERAAPYASPKNIVWRMAAAHDWMQFVLEQPMIEEPGTRFNYASGASLLLSGILQHATGMQVHAYAEQKLFDPLAIPIYYWYRNLTNPKHWSHTGGGLGLRARDLAKIGWLYANGGKWRDRQVIPASWVEASSRPRVQVNGQLWYGYQWWLLPLDSTVVGGSADVVHGRGWGGQFVLAIPRLEMVVVFNAGDFQDDALARRLVRLAVDEIAPLAKP